MTGVTMDQTIQYNEVQKKTIFKHEHNKTLQFLKMQPNLVNGRTAVYVWHMYRTDESPPIRV